MIYKGNGAILMRQPLLFLTPARASFLSVDNAGANRQLKALGERAKLIV